MTYAFDVWRVSIIGKAYSGLEDWTTGFYIGHEDADSGVPVQQDADAIKARWQTFFTASTGGVFPNNLTTTAIKITHIDAATGHAIPVNTVYSYYSTPIAGNGSGAISLPAQCTLAVTMTSSIARGLGAKGRMFLPQVGGQVASSDGKISTTIQTNTKTGMQTFFNGINTDLGIRGDVILASRGRTTGVTAGVNKQVTGVKVGDIIDTQRRRRNNLVEVYASATVTP